MLTLACVKQGTKYTAAHVNVLYDMATRNLREGSAGRFVCLTDDPTGLDPAIETVPLPETVTGWWSKLYLFAPGTFKPGEFVLYSDLDTVITGSLDAIAQYRGPFATLRDFYRPNGLQSAVMAWTAGDYDFVWNEWLAAGRPELPGGDQEWIERVIPDAVRLQDKYPGAFLSYKLHCAGRELPPKAGRVVQFHGNPKPENAPEEWVRHIWKIGGGKADDIELTCNVSEGWRNKNVEDSSQRDLPWLNMIDAHARHIAIVGGGPSLQESFNEIAFRSRAGQTIVALNGSEKWLCENGITADWHVLLDAREDNADFVTHSTAKRFLIASQCHPKVFNRLAGKNVTLWHSHTDDIENCLPGGKPVVLVASGSTVGLAAMVIAFAEGYRSIHLYGFDSSYRQGKGHAYPQPLNDSDKIIEAIAAGKKFVSTPWMVAQVHQFQQVAAELANAGAEIVVHGDGLLPTVAHAMSRVEQRGDMKQIEGIWFPVNDQCAVKNVPESVVDIDLILKHVLGSYVAVQAGGHVGIWPKALAKHFGRVYTFEPDQDNFKCLTENCQEENVLRFNAALGAKTSRAGIARDVVNSGANFITAGDTAEVLRIDDLALDGCDLICLDVEGFEHMALQGAQWTIAQYKPTVVIEDKGLSERYGVPEGFTADWLCKTHGYTVAERIGRDVVLTHQS